MSIPDVILYIGLPGSGKTYNANKYCDVVVDDITDLSELPDSEDLSGKILGITDVNFCDERILSKAVEILEEKYPDKNIHKEYFENDIDKCKANVYYRNDNRVVGGTFRRFENIYQPPGDARKVWSIE